MKLGDCSFITVGQSRACLHTIISPLPHLMLFCWHSHGGVRRKDWIYFDVYSKQVLGNRVATENSGQNFWNEELILFFVIKKLWAKSDLLHQLSNLPREERNKQLCLFHVKNKEKKEVDIFRVFVVLGKVHFLCLYEH